MNDNDSIEHVTNCIKNNLPVAFLKFGDGEYQCMTFCLGEHHNCDSDRYTKKLSNALISAFKSLLNKPNVFIGRWPINQVKEYYNMLIGNNTLNFFVYHFFIILPKDHEDAYLNNKKIELYKTIKESKLKKIIVCNKLLVKSLLLLDIDEVIIVDINNWFDNNIERIISDVINIIGEKDGNHILMTCCGMGAKVLHAEIMKLYPNGIYLDIGSSLDYVCTKKDSRGWSDAGMQYQDVYQWFEDLIPKEEWEDPKYNVIYELSKQKLGIHLHR